MSAKTDPSRALAALLCGLLAWVIAITFLVSSRLWLLLPGLVFSKPSKKAIERRVSVSNLVSPS